MLKFSKLLGKYTVPIKSLYTLLQSNVSKIEAPTLKDYLTRKDHMISGYFKDGSARFVMTDTSQTLKEAQTKFEIYSKDKLEQLGIAYNTALIMNSFLNGEERIKLVCQYIKSINEDESQMTTIYSESIGTGEVRGFVEDTKVESNQIEKENSQSFLKISKILYNQPTESYGLIKLIYSNKLTEEDIFKYFEESEQIRTHVFFHHEITQENFISQGFILQKMPDCDIEELEKIFFRIINNKNFMEINKNGLFLNSFKNVFEELGIEVELRRTPIQFFCRCSKKQFINVLTNLGKEELLDMKRLNQNIISCKNCNTNYTITDEDFEQLLK